MIMETTRVERALDDERRGNTAPPAETLIPPPAAFAATANVRDTAIYDRARSDPAAFWAEQAGRLEWRQTWERVLDWQTPWAKWFVGGRLNACENCVDRHLTSWRRNKAAILWEGEPGETRVLTYRDLAREIAQAAAVLRDLGVQAGDRVALYMPMIPELAIAILACARLGATQGSGRCRAG
jgi:acetyl-CoA synthetase